MSWLERLEVGMPVIASDGPLGWVASVPRVDLGDPTAQAEVVVLVTQELAGPGVEEFRRITREMVDHVGPDGLVLALPRASVPRASEAVAAAHRHLLAPGAPVRLPLAEERVEVATQVVERGTLVVRKKVDELLDEQRVTLREQQVQVERVVVDEIVEELPQPYLEDDGTFVVPIVEEEVIVTRRLRLKELLRVRRVVREQEELLRTPVRRERVVIQEMPANPQPGPDAPEGG